MQPRVIFESEGHRYVAEGRTWDSVNRVKDHFLPDFDKEYWLFYKSLKRCDESIWKKHTRILRYPQTVKPDLKILEAIKNDLPEDEYKKAFELEKERWELSRINGTELHNRLEAFDEENGFYIHEGIKFPLIGKDSSKFDNYSVVDDLKDLQPGCYNELLLFHKLRDFYFIGTSDKVLIDEDGGFWIKDHKTNEKYSTSKGGNYCRKPFSHIDGGKHTGYSLQLSMYAFMLIEAGFKLRGLQINHFKDYDLSKKKVYDCKYYPEVGDMFDLYAKEVYERDNFLF